MFFINFAKNFEKERFTSNRVSSLRRGHANLLCIVPILVDVYPKIYTHKEIGFVYILQKTLYYITYGTRFDANLHKCLICIVIVQSYLFNVLYSTSELGTVH